jgi:hypothetical protein
MTAESMPSESVSAEQVESPAAGSSVAPLLASLFAVGLLLLAMIALMGSPGGGCGGG